MKQIMSQKIRHIGYLNPKVHVSITCAMIEVLYDKKVEKNQLRYSSFIRNEQQFLDSGHLEY